MPLIWLLEALETCRFDKFDSSFFIRANYWQEFAKSFSKARRMAFCETVTNTQLISRVTADALLESQLQVVSARWQRCVNGECKCCSGVAAWAKEARSRMYELRVTSDGFSFLSFRCIPDWNNVTWLFILFLFVMLQEQAVFFGSVCILEYFGCKVSCAFWTFICRWFKSHTRW